MREQLFQMEMELYELIKEKGELPEHASYSG